MENILAPFMNNMELGRQINSRFLNAKIDNLKIYNYARSTAQIAWDYNRGGPVGWWKMDECQGSSLIDSSGNSNTGTITIGSSGTQTAVGNCNDGASTSAGD